MKWEYYRAPNIVKTKETLSLSKDRKNNFIVETTLVNKWEDVKILCNQKNNKWRISISEKKVTISWELINVINQSFNSEWEWITPTKIKQTNICFVRNDVLYEIRWFDNSINENDFLKSLIFN